ncbi:DUF3558 domain-containing protein [Streptomyces sp. NPDC021093]|uniref:DUF3558 domain-containing protein n=1 Tax=Streptomyces sp. NPDC021093 TaxID=3365112 RepID=UPI0037B86018
MPRKPSVYVKGYVKGPARGRVPGLVPGLALLAALTMGATGCSSDSGTADGAVDAKSGESAATAAQPGKYRTLPEPCRTIDRPTLKALLPGAETLPDEQQQLVFGGDPAVTYDTDRRVGCHWKAESPDATHLLSVDFERVVSYDAAVSDDDRAQAVYEEKLDAADLPVPRTPAAPPATPSSTASPSAPAVTGTPGAPDSPSGTPPAADSTGLEPRTLGGLGDAAFLDETKAGSAAAQDLTVSVVFRTSNVIVSVKYVEQPGGTGQIPDSKALQDRAQGLARKLAEQFSSSSE